jgi:hypothetical protein
VNFSEGPVAYQAEVEAKFQKMALLIEYVEANMEIVKSEPREDINERHKRDSVLETSFNETGSEYLNND